MKSCPKCNRTFPDEGQKFCTFDGGLLIGPQTFDPNVTIRATSADLRDLSERSEPTTSRELPNLKATIASSEQAPTVTFPRKTGRTTGPTTSDLVSPAPTPPQSLTAPPVAATVQAPPKTPKKRSKLPWIIVGALVLLLLGAGAAAGFFFIVVKPRLEGMPGRRTTENLPPRVEETNKNANPVATPAEAVSTPSSEADSFVPPPNSVAFENSRAKLDGKLAEHYFDFSFYYPRSWKLDPKAGTQGASNFVRVERSLPPDFTQENFVVGWYTSKGTFTADEPSYSKRVEEFSTNLAKIIPEYRKVSDGPTKINSMDAYEFRWEGFSKGTEKGDLHLWGRVVFLPTGVDGDQAGATLSMLATSLATELSGVDDVGAKGELPQILESFRFGKKK